MVRYQPAGFRIPKIRKRQSAFFIRYRVGKQQRKITLSKYSPGILAQVRRKAVDVLAEARLGHDARADDTKRSAGAELDLGEAVRLYLDARQPELDPTWFIEVNRFLERYWARFHGRRLQSLERGEMVRELDEIARTRDARTADHARKALSALFAWATDRGYVGANPLAQMKRRGKGNGRERVLSMAEGTSKGGVAGIYNRGSYEIQKRAALDRWCNFVLQAVASFDEGGADRVGAFVKRAREQLEP